MSILAWLVVGFVAGGLARRITGSRKRGCLATIAVGIIGAFVGGALYRLATGSDSTAFDELDLGSVLVALLGSIVFLLVLDAIRPRSRR
ncbi:MAG: GlsB/YeaQ/YmgE family stress response membrane protein [Acidimicrobiales bacterium]|nr:GlsB/YeaQ/YmgE family stress response membrane protein [Acidimicrobiales bacterium]